MPYSSQAQPEPTREEVDRMSGPVLLEFGASWCPHCQGVQPDLAALLDQHAEWQHIKVEDGKGKPLGRSFRVKLWPTLIFLRDGQPVQRLERPSSSELQAAFTSG